jgi:hypothetical protein
VKCWKTKSECHWAPRGHQLGPVEVAGRARCSAAHGFHLETIVGIEERDVALREGAQGATEIVIALGCGVCQGGAEEPCLAEQARGLEAVYVASSAGDGVRQEHEEVGIEMAPLVRIEKVSGAAPVWARVVWS